MRISKTKQAMWWTVILAILGYLIWLLGPVLMPFIMGAAIAYLLDPIADRLEARGMSRILAVAIITLIAIALFIGAMLWLVPTLARQVSQLIETLPSSVGTVNSYLEERFPAAMAEDGTIRTQIDLVVSRLDDSTGEVASYILSGFGNFVGVMVNVVLIPVIVFYLLLDWDRMVARVDDMLPVNHRETIREVARDVDHSIAGFIRGQSLVILILAIFYSVSLLLVGLPYAILIGCLAASLSFVPYVGAIIGGISSIGVAAFAFYDDPIWIAAVAGIFLIGQAVEGNILTPNLVGSSVNLHPVWLILALSVFGLLFGFVGMLMAVPVSAALGVIVRFVAARYRQSALYTGHEVPPPPPQPTRVELVPRGTLEAERRHAREVKTVVEARVEAEEKALQRQREHVAQIDPHAEGA